MCGSSALLSVLLAGVAAALASSSSSDLFDNQLGDINYCKKQCQLTIKNKSPAKVSWPLSYHCRCCFLSLFPAPPSASSFSSFSRGAPGRCASLCGKPQHQQQTGRYILLFGEGNNRKVFGAN